MKKPTRYCVLFSFLILLLSHETFPQTHIPEKIQFKHLTRENSLSGNSIWCVLKDRKGFIWVGTLDGLSRYDGRKFKVFKYSLDDPKSLSANEVKALYEDKSGTLWVGTWGGGLNRYNPEQENFTRFINPDDSSKFSNSILTMLEDKSGNIWIGTNKGGLNIFDREKGKFICYKNNPEDHTSLSDDKIWSLMEDSNGNMWIGTIGGGLNKFNHQNKTFTHYLHNPNNPVSLSNNSISGICEDNSGAIWLGTYGGGISKLTFSGKNHSPVFTNFKYEPNNPYGVSDTDIDCIFIDKSNTLWFGTGKGGLNRTISPLDKISSPSFISYKHDPYDPSSLSGNVVPYIYEDNSGLYWVATIGDGLNILDTKQKQFRQYEHEPANPFSLSGNDVLIIYEDKDGIVWISTRRDGLNKWDRIKNRFTHYKNNPDDPNSLSDNRIYSIYEDSKGFLWLGTYNGGLNRFDKKTEKFNVYKRNPLNSRSISGDNIFSITEDKFGTLWITTLDNGINKYDRKSNSFFNINYNPDSLKILTPNPYSSIYLVDNSGILWIGNKAGGLILYDVMKDDILYYDHDPNNTNSLSSNSVSTVYENKSGIFWIGTTGGGLNKFDKHKGQFTRYSMKDGLPTDVIYGILADEQDNLWISTDNGLSKFNPQSETFRNYDIEDGLLSNEFEEYSNSCKISTGELIFSNGNGFIIFHPDSIKDNTDIPPIYITDFYLFNKPVQIGYDSLSGRTILSKSVIESKELELNYDDNVFSFEFAALDYHAPLKNKYAYIMEGFDKDWTYTDAIRNLATYTNLDPGEYTFRVKGSNNDGVWNEKGASIRIIILPPWWRTNLAYIIYFLLIGSIIYLTWKAQLKRIKIKNEFEMSKFEAQKLHEVDELKSRFFTNISHEFRTPLTLIQGPAKQIIENTNDSQTKDSANFIYRNSLKLIRLVNQLLDLSKLEAGEATIRATKTDVVAFIKEIVLSFTPLADKKKITLELNNKEEEILAYLDRDKFYKIINNILSNAFKFTAEFGKINVSIDANNSMVEIKISDTGIGIPVEKINKIFDRFYQVDGSHTRDQEGTGIGLALTKELVDLLKGNISVQSKEGEGSTFTISFPLGKDHLKSEQISEIDEVEQHIPSFGDDEITVHASLQNKFDTDSLKQQQKLTLLVVEDNPDVRLFIKGIFKNEYEIYEASNGKEGLKIAFEEIPDLIISDLMMPKMDGIEMCSKLKSDERTSHIPIIMLTAKATDKEKIEGYETGADEYITKPFDSEVLKARVKNIIEQRRKLKEHFAKDGLFNLDDKNISRVDKVFLQKVVQIVNNHISDASFGVETFASEIALSRKTLHKKLVSLIGEPPSELIKRIRLSKAAKLLQIKHGNISEISLDVGFNNPAYFSDCFRKQFGISPSQYHQKFTNY